VHGTLRHHGCTTGRSLWGLITVTLGLALGQQVSAATEGARETPPPDHAIGRPPLHAKPGSDSNYATHRRTTHQYGLPGGGA
jgi:hypothetical protein